MANLRSYWWRASCITTCLSASLPRESVSFERFKLSALTMPGRGKRANGTAKAIIYNVYKYFEKESAKNKCRRPPKLTSKTAEATGYSERTVRRIVAKKSKMSGAAFTSPAKKYKVERKRIMLDDLDATTCTQFLSREEISYARFCAGSGEGERNIRGRTCHSVETVA